jgi:hypothetical protein
MNIKIVDFKKINSDKIVGFLTIELELGMRISGISIFYKNDEKGRFKRWIGFPGRKYTNKDGQEKWENYISFLDRKDFFNFQDMILKLADQFDDGQKSDDIKLNNGAVIKQGEKMNSGKPVQYDDIPF